MGKEKTNFTKWNDLRRIFDLKNNVFTFYSKNKELLMFYMKIHKISLKYKRSLLFFFSFKTIIVEVVQRNIFPQWLIKSKHYFYFQWMCKSLLKLEIFFLKNIVKFYAKVKIDYSKVRNLYILQLVY